MFPMAAPAFMTDRPARTLRDVAAQFSADAEVRSADLERRVHAIAQAKRDAVADTRALTAHVNDVHDAAPDAPPHPQANIVLAGPQDMRIAINDLAHDQIAERTGIPKPYYRRMLADQPGLLAENINTWFQRESGTRLFRMLTPIDGMHDTLIAHTRAAMVLRGVMGASYRAIDDAELVATLLPIARAHGALLKEFSLDDRRLHAQFVTAEQSVQDIRTRVAEQFGLDAAQVGHHQQINGRDVSWVNEVIRAGFSLRNSEVGFAAMEVASFLDVLKCLNGLIVPAEATVRHVGKRLKADDGEARWISATTQTLDNAALMSRAKDAALAALDDQQVVKLGNTLLAAKVTEVELGQPTFEWVANVSGRLGLNEAQTALLQEETVSAVVEERRELAAGMPNAPARITGAPTQFALVQGLTAVARQQPDFDRRVELERTGWKWLTSTAADLVKLGAPGTK
jgi:hypothetical protein